MSIYICSLVVYVVGFVVMFKLLVHGDKANDMEFDLVETLTTSFLWPFYAVAIVCIDIYEFIKRKKQS